MFNIFRRIDKAKDNAYKDGYNEGLSKGYEEGVKEVRSKGLIRTEDELKFMKDEGISSQDREKLTTLVNSQQYESLKSLLIRHALMLYREARSEDPEENKIKNRVGEFIENTIVPDLDTLIVKPKHEQPTDIYQ